jgi:hypothetical protein
LCAKRGKEKTHGSGIVLSAIVSLKGENGKTKLGVYVGDESTYGRKNIRLITKRNCPEVMSVIIQKHNVIFITRMIVNW